MPKFDTVLEHAARHHGSRDAVLKLVKDTYAEASLSDLSDDRLLSTMTRCVFNAGFNWKVIEAKWPGFEAAFNGFDPQKLAFFGDEMLGELVSDARIVRNGQKIRATLENARFVSEVAKEVGSFGKFLDDWPRDDQLGLMAALNKRGSRLGGATAQYFLRWIGWDAWIASQDVCKALMRDGVLEKPEAKTKAALTTVQAAFNALHAESGLPRAELSRLLALSVG